MKCLSLYQPWASLVAHGLKRVETRSWAHPDPLPAILAVHATAKVDERLVAGLINHPKDGPHFRRAFAAMGVPCREFQGRGIWAVSGKLLPAGCVVAVVRVIACAPTTHVAKYDTTHEGPPMWAKQGLYRYLHITEAERAFGDYSPGRHGWVFDRVLRLDPPVPAKGNRMLWEWKPTLEAEAWAQQQLKGGA